MVKRLKAFDQQDEVEIRRLRLKRGLFLLLGLALFLGGVRVLTTKGLISAGGFPIDQEQLVNLAEKVLGKAQGVLGREVKEEESNRDTGEGEEDGELGGSSSGKVAGVTPVEKRVEEIIEMIKNLPEEQAEKIRTEVMRGICEEVCRD